MDTGLPQSNAFRVLEGELRGVGIEIGMTAIYL